MKRRSFIKRGWMGLSGLGLAQAGFGAPWMSQENSWERLNREYNHAPVVETYTRDMRVRSGVALGGIGTGSIELRKDGNFYNWSIFNNYPRGTGPAFSLPARPHAYLEDSCQFFIVRYQVAGEKPQLKLLQLNDSLQEGGLEGILYYYPWMSGVQQIEYAARFPFVNMRFTDEEMPFDIEMEAFSPFIPHDIKNSSLPLVYFNFSFQPKISKPVDILLVGTQRNLAGYDEVHKYFDSSIIEKEGYKFFSQSVGGMDEKRSTFGHMGLGAIGGEEVTYYLGWEHKHPYYEKLLVQKRFENIDDTAGRNTTTENGEKIGRIGNKTNDQRCFSSIGISKTLAGGKGFDATIMMAWHFPNAYGAIQDSESRGPAKPLEKDHVLGLARTKLMGNYYERSFPNLEAVAQYGFEKQEELRARSRHFLEGMYTTDVEQYILDQVNSQFNTFITSSTLTREGKFAIREGMTAEKSWGPNATADVSLYGSAMILALFPELQKSMMRLHRNLQAPGGEINHGIGYDPDYTQNGTFGVYHRIDLVPNYIQMVLRDYLWTNDKAYLEEMWPSIKKGINYVLEHVDKDGDQMPEMRGIMCSYDNFPMYGLAAYLQSQWIAAMELAAIAAEDMGERDLQKKYKEIAEAGKQLMEEKLWNGQYFRLANDYKGDKGKDEGCLTDQLIGQWIAHCAGLGRLFDQEKVRSALKTILKYSFIDEKFLRNCTWPEHRNLFPIEESNLWVDQANTPWTGVELAFASLLIFEGLVEEGKKVIRGVDSRYRREGLYWDHQEFGGHYYRPMSAWAIMNALSGFSLVKNEYQFRPARWEAEGQQYFFAANTGTGHIIRGKEGELAIEAHSGELVIMAIALPAGLWKDGRKTEVCDKQGKLEAREWREGKEGLLKVVFAEPVVLKEGDTLAIGAFQKLD